MDSSLDLDVIILGMVRATLTRVVGPDALQVAEPRVRVIGQGAPRPRVEISLRYGGETCVRTFVLEDEPDRIALEHSVNDAFLPMLEEMGLLPPEAEAVDDPPLGQPTVHQIDH
ncbi:MAG: hypothetical protein JO352_22320 [Chloroflexi bacterium]|nr:hypothetical protein [Chloroflexota bacterium]